MALQTAASAPSPTPSSSAAAPGAAASDAPAPSLVASTASTATAAKPAVSASNAAATALASLPENCKGFQPQPGTSVIVCAAPKEGLIEKLAMQAPSFALSVVAIILSLRSLWYTQRKDARARKQSIEDDYWLRKVVSPVSIEPLLQFAAQLPVKLPSSDDVPAQAKQAGDELLQTLRALSASFLVTRLLSEAVAGKVADALERAEDGLANYLGALKQYMDTPQEMRGAPPSRPEAITNLSSALIRVLDPIKEHQSNVGAQSATA